MQCLNVSVLQHMVYFFIFPYIMGFSYYFLSISAHANAFPLFVKFLWHLNELPWIPLLPPVLAEPLLEVPVSLSEVRFVRGAFH